MNGWEAFSLILLGVALCICFGWAIVLARVWTTIDTITKLSPTPLESGDEPSVSVVVVVSEGRLSRVKRLLRSLRMQEGVSANAIVVVDQQGEEADAAFAELQEDESAALVLRTKKQPNGWISRNYAYELGQGRADGEYLLFTEADVVFGRRAIQTAVATMKNEQLEHLAVAPRLEATTLFEAMVLPLYFLLYEFRFIDRRCVDPDSGVGAGHSAFNLVRADAYRLRGTHARIRTTGLQGEALGQLMRDDGGRGTIMRAVSEVRLKPQRTATGVYGTVQRGALCALGYSSTLTFLTGTALFVAAWSPIAFLFAGGTLAVLGHIPWAAIPAVAALALPAIGLLKARTMIKFEPLAALLYPIGAAFIAGAAIQAALAFGIRGSLTLGGRTYHKKDLHSVWS